MNYDAATRQTDHRLLGDGAYEHCRTSFDWLRGAACFARRSWLQSPQTSVVRVERRADTPGGSREHHCTCARCILRSEEHTSELQSLRHLVCRLLLEKKKKKRKKQFILINKTVHKLRS